MKPPPLSTPADAAARTAPAQPDWAALRARLDGVGGQHYWRSLEQLAETPDFRELLQREFPPGAAEWWDGLDRRSFLKLAAASLALAGLSACTKQPTEEILPYVKQPAELVLGEPLFYATAMVLGGFATGVLAKSREGHPIKVDGNPDHPAAARGSSVWMQASILDLYDPDRSPTVTHHGEISDWARFLADLNQLSGEQQARHGAGLRFLTGTVTSPTLAWQLEQLLERFPQAKWHSYEPISRDHVHAGARLAFGEVVEAHYRFEQAAVILALDADFLHTHPERLRYAWEFTNGRRLSAGRREMNRLYVAESTPTITGTMADHRLPIASGVVEGLARWLAMRLGAPLPDSSGSFDPLTLAWLETVLRDLEQHRGSSLVLAGEWQPPAVHALAHALNEALGNAGRTVEYLDSAEARPGDQLESLRALADELRRGAVDTLIMLGGNPAYAAPADLDLARLLPQVRRSIYLGQHLDETAALCTWHIPQTHYLESWSDARSFDGTVTLLQPLIAPLYGGRSAHELLGALVQPQPLRNDYEIVREFWRGQQLWPDFDAGWRRALHDGWIQDTRTEPRPIRVQTDFMARLAQGQTAVPEPPSARVEVTSTKPTEAQAFPFGAPVHTETLVEDVEVVFRPDPHVWDGRFANNGWLQECPKPVSKLTWDNAVLISPLLAQRAGLAAEDVVEISFQGRTVRGPVWVLPGQAAHTVTLPLGYGRRRAGRIGTGVGFDAYALRPSTAVWGGTGGRLRKTAQRHLLAATQTHQQIDSPDRQVYRGTTLAEFLAHPQVVKESVESPKTGETLYDPSEYPYTGYKWGMSIDLTTCIGCNACVLACNIENNIPVVGKDQVRRNREMLWLRVDTYFRGSLDRPEYHHQPVPCMHCEHAPCELVCPVAATVHDAEGLNLQVYNRCVGTRFCSNNCPYKVRRFNFLRYAPYDQPDQQPRYNPEVTVRWRGVMEKCTYCLQRIAAGRIRAEKDNRRLQDGEVRTACQQACPAEAIVFGDLNDPHSRIARLKQDPLDYSMLGQLNTRPRTTYLAKVTNPPPDVAAPLVRTTRPQA